MTALLHEHRVALVFRQYAYLRTGSPDLRRADENSLQLAFSGTLFEIGVRVDVCDAAIDLPAVSVSLYREIHQPKAFLLRIGDVLGEKNCARACAENRLRPRKVAQRLF